MGTETQFRTFQTVRYYEEALARHGQWCRWLKVLTCPCVTKGTGQADLQCTLCGGRGKIFRNPGPFTIQQEIARHDGNGKVYPKNTPIIDGTITVWKSGTSLSLGTQPGDGSYIQLATPFPRNYERIRVDYQFNPTISVIDENSEVYDTNTLRVIAARFVDKGQDYEGSIDSVSRVYNVDKAETYTVTLAQKEFIYLENMGTWADGDVLQVDYVYLQPFDFLLHSISSKRRYESAYIQDQADATLVSPYWAQIAPNDIITSLSAKLPAYAVIDPAATGAAGNDVVVNYYDLSDLTHCIDVSGAQYVVGTDLVLYGRNEIQWLTTKPTVKYTVHFRYHPTFTGLTTYDTARNSENKSFVNRTNVMLYDKVSGEVSF
jgi:hypothetical protein